MKLESMQRSIEADLKQIARLAIALDQYTSPHDGEPQEIIMAILDICGKYVDVEFI